MIKSQVILERTYDAESIIDLDDDFHWALNESEVSIDDRHLTGTFEVIITWKEEKEEE